MKKKKNASDIVFDTFNICFMSFVLVALIYPFIYIISYSLSEPSKVGSGLIFLPQGLSFESYRKLLGTGEMLNGLVISVTRSSIGPFIMIVITSMAAYAISRENMLLVGFFRKYFIFTMYFSGGIIPVYILIKTLHLTNNYLVYILPNLVAVFFMVLIRTYIESLPKDLENAATMDGANELVMFFKVIFPLCKPVIAAVALFACVGQWNSYIDTQLYNYADRKLYPLQYILYYYLNAASDLQIEDLQKDVRTYTVKTLSMSITVITVLPIACVYPFLQKYFASGLLVGSVKA